MWNRLLAVVAVVCACTTANAITVKRATGPIRIDAVLDEPAWADATPIRIEREWFPGDDIPAAVETEALITWDDDTLYIAFRAFDPQPGQIRARFAERDRALNDDNVGLM
ncbi:MAG TPA: hypothetical protein VMS12_04285, partial [Thermoanaerobaculia bacterium]|nr:hypothetical protein [Thermoanaerobaculia bacterium]